MLCRFFPEQRRCQLMWCCEGRASRPIIMGMNRRAFLQTTASGFFAAPAVMSRVLQEPAAPAMPGGVQVGDVTSTRAMIWSAADRPARMMIEISRDERFTAPADRGAGRAREQPVHRKTRSRRASRPANRCSTACGSTTSRGRPSQRAGHRPLPRRAHRRPPPHLLLVRRRRRPGLGHQSRVRRHAPLRNDGAAQPGPVHPLGRHDLRRRPAAAGSEAGRWDGVEEPGDAGQEQGGRDAGRVPRQLRLQPARHARARVQQPGADDRAVGRSRGA